MSENKEVSVESTYKSMDTEEWLDIHFNRPIGFWWAKLFNRFDVHPNTVTILSIIIGAIAGVCFYFDKDNDPENWFLMNVLGCLLLTWANFYDSADGQLARMSGKKSRLGRILDGMSADVWFYIIYFAVCFRLMDNNIPFTDVKWSYWIFPLAAFSGMVCHRYECSLADYYRNIHLYFLKGEDGSELDDGEEWRRKYQTQSWKDHFFENLFAWGYANYTQQQEGVTKNWQALHKAIKEKWGTNIPQKFRDDFRVKSKPLMKWTNILTHNTRAIVLYIGCLIDMPWIYFAFEMTVLMAILIHMRNEHEKFSKEFLENLSQYEQ